MARKFYRRGHYVRYGRRRGGSDAALFLGAAIIGAILLLSVLSKALETFARVDFALLFAFVFALVIAVGSIGGALYIGYRQVLAYFRRKNQDIRFERYTSLSQLQKMDPQEFEEYVAWVYECRGYSAFVTPFQSDHGIDILLKRGLSRTAVQVKRYKKGNFAGEPELRDFYGSYTAEKIKNGIFVTTGHYSTAARTWAQKVNMALVDGGQLAKMAGVHAD